jgi:orotate phosphoribosyltransferase
VQVRSETEEPFELKSGKKSRVFIDIKKATLNPDTLKKLLFYLYDKTVTYDEGEDEDKHIPFNRIASVAVGGIPIATALSLHTGTPQIIVRSEKHDRGTKSQVIGDCNGMNCVLIEDVATTGGSIVNAVKAIRDAGGICSVAFVIVDREEGAGQVCRENGVRLFSCLKKRDFIGGDE